jgi:hypothetical protein
MVNSKKEITTTMKKFAPGDLFPSSSGYVLGRLQKNWSHPRQRKKQHRRGGSFGVQFIAVNLCFAAVVVFVQPQRLLGAPGSGVPESRFKSTVQSKLVMAEGGQDHKVEADAVIEYEWKRDGKVRTLVFHEMSARTALDGTERENTKMSRTGFEDANRGKTIKLEEAPDQLKKLLSNLFGTPVCELEVDAAGKELKRTILAEPGAAQIIEQGGMIANTLLFHPWYSTDTNEWQARMEIGTGQGGVAGGNVTYTKVTSGKGVQAVKVSGTLTTDGAKVPTGLKYVVSGEQTYDISLGEWVAGKLTMDVTIDSPERAAKGQGQMLCTLEMLPLKQ